MARQSGSERRQQIIEAALRILSIQGVQRLTAMEIAREVGIADGTIFRHFQNKDEIIAATMTYLEALLFAAVPPADAPPLHRLRLFFLNRLELVRRNPAVVRLAFSDRLAEAAGETNATKFLGMMERSRAFVRQCILEAQARGEIAGDIPAEVMTQSVIGILRGAAMASPEPSRGEASALTAEVVWEGVEKLLRRSNGG